MSTCCLKTQRFGSVKNRVGRGRQVPARPTVAVLDAMEAFISGGPEAGATVSPGAILVGRDRVALAAVGVARLRLSGARGDVASGLLFDQAQIGRAAALGWGPPAPRRSIWSWTTRPAASSSGSSERS